MEKHWFLVDKQGHREILFAKCEDINISGGGSRSVGYASRKLLVSCEGIPSNPCKICGRIFGTNYVESTKKRLIETNTCLSCCFWEDKEKMLSDKNFFVIEGAAYYKKNDVSKYSSFVGFGGAEFKIRRFGSDEIITTRNLWHNGEIYEWFKDRIKNNAELLMS